MNTEPETTDPLHDKEAERAVLGALLVNPKPDDLIPRVISILGTSPDAFFTVAHQLIYSAVVHLYDQSGTADTLMVAKHLKDTNQLSRLKTTGVPGNIYLNDLQSVVVETDNTVFHADAVRDQWERRKLLAASGQIKELAHQYDKDIGELQAQALDLVFDLTLQTTAKKQSQPISHNITTLIKQIEERAKNPQSTAGIPTGFTDFDLVSNGLHPGNFIVLAGRPGMGKTAFAINIAQNICLDQHRPVAFFSLEMTREELETRILASESSLSYADLRAGRIKDDQWSDITEAAARIANDGNIIVNDNRTLTLGGLKMEARHIKSRHEDLALVIVDYVQLLHGDRDYQNREREVADISRALKILAYELDVPVIGCSQLNRESEKNKRKPSLANLRDSGALEQDADLAAFLHYDEEADNTLRQLLILKNRNGPLKDLELRFQPESMTFTDITPETNNDDTFGL